MEKRSNDGRWAVSNGFSLFPNRHAFRHSAEAEAKELAHKSSKREEFFVVEIVSSYMKNTVTRTSYDGKNIFGE